MIGSFTPFLVEDVVRMISEESGGKDFLTKNEALIKLNKLEKDQGNLYVNIENLGYLLGTLFKSPHREFMNSLSQSGKNTYQDIRVEGQEVALTGFSFTKRSTSFISLFEGQQARGYNLHHYIPNRAGLMVHYSLSDVRQFGNAFNEYISDKKDIQKAREFIRNTYGYDVNQAYEWMGNEIALGVMESVDKNELSKLILIEYADVGEALRQLNELSEAVSIQTDDSVYIEIYGDFEIRDLAVRDIPKALFGRSFGGFDRFIYTIYNDVILVTEDIQTLKTVIGDLALDNTWGKTVKMSSFIDDLGENANYSVIINTSRIWNIAIHAFNEPWKSICSENLNRIQSIEKLALQQMHLKDKFYSSLLIRQDPARISSSGTGDYQEI
jgi:hypothetical protein